MRQLGSCCETAPLESYVVVNTEDDDTGAPGDCGSGGDCTLRQAIADANNSDRSVITRIVFARGVVGYVVEMSLLRRIFSI